MKKTISLVILFLGFVNLGFSQMTKSDAEYELSRYTKNTCYRFSLSDMNSIKETDVMVSDNFEIKFGESVMTITAGDVFYVIPYSTVAFIKSSSVATKKEGRFTIFLH